MENEAAGQGPVLSDGIGPDVTAWVCEYMSGEVFVSLAQYPMNDPDVRKAWRLFTIAQRDTAVAAERERCARVAEDFLTQGRSPLGRSVAAAIRGN